MKISTAASDIKEPAGGIFFADLSCQRFELMHSVRISDTDMTGKISAEKLLGLLRQPA